jgi:glutamate-1-semialdehyde 2,1-aminomutase
MATAATEAALGSRLDELIEEQERIFVGRQPRSRDLAERARRSLAGGVTSSWQISRPQTVWVGHGRGSKIYDADGTEYVDLHGGYGAMLVGHAHPAIVEAVSAQVARGTHFAQPTEDAICVADELARRFGLPLWRFGNSGTETTMDAVHVMRAVTGRDLIVKIEGAYHGHHDSVMVSVYNPLAEIGPAEHPRSAPSASGLPKAITDLTPIVGFNDAGALEEVFDEHPGEIAGVIMEPAMMNAGIIPPVGGYLETVRDVTRRHGALLAFDEVKTGLTVSPGGMTARSGVTPDIVCLAKAQGGGLPCGAIGGTEEVMGHIADGSFDQVGTFNGNPLTMAASRATVCEILDEAAYDKLGRLGERMVNGCRESIERWDLPAHMVSLGAKGCVTFSTEPVRNYRDFLRIDERYSHCHWLFQHNGGVFLPPWGKSEQWLVSVQHTDEDVDRFLANFEDFAARLRSA